MIVLVGMIVGTAAALAWPGPFLAVKPALRPAFAVTMLFVGTLVDPAQVRSFLGAPLRPLAGLLAQYTIMPLIAAAVSLLFADPNVRIGTVLVGCMPGAMASNVMTVLFRGDLLLSVTMTTLATLLCPIAIAVWLPLLAGTQIPVPVGGLVSDAILLVVLPVLAGLMARQFVSALPPWWNRTATFVASAAILLIILVVVAANRDPILESGAGIGLAMLGLNLCAYAFAFAVGRLYRWPPRQRRTLVIEVGMQNAGLGTVLATTHLGTGGAVPSAFYTALCVLTAAVALPLARRGRDGELAPIGDER